LHLIKIFFASISILRVDGGVSNEDIRTPQTFSVTFLPTSCAVFLYRVRKKFWLVREFMKLFHDKDKNSSEKHDDYP